MAGVLESEFGHDALRRRQRVSGLSSPKKSGAGWAEALSVNQGQASHPQLITFAERTDPITDDCINHEAVTSQSLALQRPQL